MGSLILKVGMTEILMLLFGITCIAATTNSRVAQKVLNCACFGILGLIFLTALMAVWTISP